MAIKVLEITGRIPSKKNSKKIIPVKGRMIIVSSTDYTKWEREAKKQLALQVQPGTRLFKGQITLKIFAHDRRACDLTNKAESIMDLLVACGHLEDDNWFICPDIRLVFGGVDKENPRAEIYSEE